MNESQNTQTLVPTNYYLFSVTFLLDGLRKFIDIPIYSHKLIFPKRTDVFEILCKMYNLNMSDEKLFMSFAVMNIFKFECKEDYLSYIGELKIE